MPRKEIQFENTLIYKLVCNDINIKELYVGHTTNFIKRKANHKSSCNNENGKNYNLKVYSFVRENGGWENWSMIQIEEYNCNSLNEACARERYWMEQLNATLNSCIPGRTEIEIKEQQKEYYVANKIEIKEHQKEYYVANKIEIKEHQKEYYVANKIEIKEQRKEYYVANKIEIKEYYVANKIEIKEQKKEYYVANKIEFKEYYVANKNKIKEQQKLYQETNKEHIKLKRHEAYLKKKNKDI